MLLVEALDGCHEVSIYCDGTGVTRFLFTDAQGGTFVNLKPAAEQAPSPAG